MNTIIYMLVVVIACFAAYLVYVVAEPALKHFGFVKNIRVIAFVVAMVTLLAILDLGSGVVALLLIPYAALGIALVVLFLMGLLGTKTNWQYHNRNQHWQQSVRKIMLDCSRSVRRVLESILHRLPR